MKHKFIDSGYKHIIGPIDKKTFESEWYSRPIKPDVLNMDCRKFRGYMQRMEHEGYEAKQIQELSGLTVEQFQEKLLICGLGRSS